MNASGGCKESFADTIKKYPLKDFEDKHSVSQALKI